MITRQKVIGTTRDNLHWFWPVFAYLVFTTSDTVIAVGAPSAYLTASEVRATIGRALAEIESMRVKYVVVTNLENPTGDYMVRDIKMKRPCLVFHEGAHGNKRQTWTDDLQRQRAWVQTDRYINDFPWRRSYFFDNHEATASLPGSLHLDAWFQCSGLWPIEQRTPPLAWGLTPMLHVIAMSDDYDQIRPKLVRVDGRWCHVLERVGIDALWIDCERPPGLMKRQTWIPANGRLHGHLVLSGHKELSPGIWIPFSCRNRAFDTEQAASAHLIMDYSLTVTEASVNNIKNSAFVYVAPAGSISFPAKYNDRGRPDRSPGGLDHFDQILDWIHRNHVVDWQSEFAWQSIVMFALSGAVAIMMFTAMCQGVIRSETLQNMVRERQMTMRMQKPNRFGYIWLELLLTLAFLVLVLQLFPSLWFGILWAVDIRNWPRTIWFIANWIVLVSLIAVRYGPSLYSDWTERQKRVAAAELKKRKQQEIKEQRVALVRIEEAKKRRVS